MVYGVGYCSKDKYKYSNTKDKCFLTWRNMLKRCYSQEQKYDNYREQEIEVCLEWHDFYNFKQWYDRNYYEVEGEKMHLDKDIITKGNKMYCPENCVFVPEKINRLYIKDKRHRGDLPIGVTYSKKRNMYQASCGIDGKKNKSLHKDVYSAFNAYKTLKENHARSVAQEYKDKIPPKIYNSIMMFTVDLDD
jgi:hypothetical protein